MTHSQVTRIVSYTSQRIHICEPGSHCFKMSNFFLLFNKPAKNLIIYIWEIHRRINTLTCYQIYAYVKPPYFTFLHHRELKDIMPYCTLLNAICTRLRFMKIKGQTLYIHIWFRFSLYIYILHVIDICERFWHPKSPATFFNSLLDFMTNKTYKLLVAGL